MITLFFLGRFALFVLYFDKFQNSDVHYWLSFLYGLRMDTIVASMLLVIPLLLLTLSPRVWQQAVAGFLKYYFLIVISILIYIEVATFPFFAQYDVRPNYLFVEYLEYPKEVFSMILAEYKLELAIAFIMIGGFIMIYLRKAQSKLDGIFAQKRRYLWSIPLLLLLFIGIRSSFGHRPANISDAMYSSDRTVNEITKNSIYSIGYAIYTNAKNGSKSLMRQYGKMEIQEAIGRVEKRLGIESIEANSPLKRLEKSHFKQENPKNLVIFLQESLGAQFVAATGGEEGITPNLNRLATEGILFKDAYSNGTRSIRGIAGSVAGNFSVPGKGILKRNKSQKDFFNIAKLLKPYGYYTQFIYGGESRFDNMKSWFLGNGFDKIIDEEKFENPDFVGTWGVCDDEVVQRANEEFKKLHAEGKRFATVIFSTSNHSPFDFPDGKIKLIDGVEKKSVKNAIKYADFAIGKFIDLAKKESYYKDTVFVIVADHNVRVYGKDMIPVNMFHIPAIILGEGITPLVYEKIATQPDILATALDLLGLDLTYPIMGHSIFSDDKQNISLMQFNASYALRVEDKVAIIRPGKEPLTFTYHDKHLTPAPDDSELEADVRAFVIVLNYLYEKQLYR
jgi:phosphoglycerol transferase MdoB-like AlkP superfamily enzyme